MNKYTKSFPPGDFTVRTVMDFFDCTGGKAQVLINALRVKGDVQTLYKEKNRINHYYFIHEDREKSIALLNLAFVSPTRYVWMKGARK